MPGTRFFAEKDAAAGIVLCFTMARMVQRRESRKLCRMIAGCWTGRDRSLAGWRRCGTGLQTGKGRGIVAHMALFFSNVRPDSCKEFFLSFSRLTLGKKTWADCWICRSGLREGLSEKNSLEERAGRIAWEGAWREEGRQEGVRREDDGGKSL